MIVVFQTLAPLGLLPHQSGTICKCVTGPSEKLPNSCVSELNLIIGWLYDI